MDTDSNDSKKPKLIQYIKANSHKLMTIFIILQCVVEIAFIIMFLLSNSTKDFTVAYKIFVCANIVIFTAFMIHFAYHSVSYFLILLDGECLCS